MEHEMVFHEEKPALVTPPRLALASTNLSSTNSTLAPASSTKQVGMARVFNHRGTVHQEHHSQHGDVMRDLVVGFADGLTVPFALTAGLSSLGSNKLVIIGGLAELFSGAISMGLGGYLASVTEADTYEAEEKRERREVATVPDAEREEIFQILEPYGISREVIHPLVDQLAANEDMWIKFMMDFELQLKKPAKYRAWQSGGSLAISYFLGGLIPMIPYFAMQNVTHALFVSIGITVVILLVFGAVKNYITVGTKRATVWGAVQTLIIGVIAAAASYGIVRALDSKNPVMTQGAVA